MADIATTPITTLPEALTVSDTDTLLVVQSGKAKRAKAALMKGAKGDTGTEGAYFEYRFAKNSSATVPPALTNNTANPAGWTTTVPAIGETEYLWLISAKKTAAGALLQNWSTPACIKGGKGDKGDKGDPYVASHSQLTGLDSDDCHPMSAITGLEDFINNIKYGESYGIEFDTTIANPACKRIGKIDNHASLPIQSKMRRCLLKDDGTVNYYLDANDSTKKENGTAAILDGTDGQVMVEIPEHWRKFEAEGTKRRVLISENLILGFHFVPKCYRSAYQAAIDRTVSSAPKLASVVNNTPQFRGGNNTIAWDGTYRSLLGVPASNVSLANFRAYARRRGTSGKNGAGWNCDVYDIQKICFWLYIVEYANLNCQLPFNSQLDASGYKQGGLGDGVTTLDINAFGSFNSSNPFIPCGYTNNLGNRTGVVDFVMPTEYGSGLTVKVPTWRGIEIPFGHIFSLADGCKVNIQANNAGGQTLFYICGDPSKFQDSNYNDYEFRGLLLREATYIKEMLIGEFGDNMPKPAPGASSTTFFCDYFFFQLPASGEAQKALCFGGSAIDGGIAGIGYSNVYLAPSGNDPKIGTRLCFIP